MIDNIFEEAQKEIALATPEGLVNGLEILNNVSKEEFAANKTVTEKQMDEIIPEIKKSILANQEQLPPELEIPKLITNIEKKLPKSSSSRFSSEISKIFKMAKGATVETIATQLKNRQNTQLENAVFKDALVDDDVLNMQFSEDQILPQANLSPAERSIMQFKPLLSIPISYVSPENVPKSIGFLSKYAESQDKIPISSITNSSGLSYVGVTKEDTNGSIMLTPFPKNEIERSEFPKLDVQLRYHANKTINSWNKFVSDEANLVNFVKEISTEKSRNQYLEKQFQNMNLYTFAAETLATLCFYYVYIPMQLYVVNRKAKKKTKEDFFENYEVGTNPKTNPLMLSSVNGLPICKKLLNEGVSIDQFLEPVKLLSNNLPGLRSLQNSINNKEMKKIIEYYETRQTSARAFFESSGISNEMSVQLLARKDFSSIKQKPFIVAVGLENTYYNDTIKKILDSGKKTNLKEKWDQTWGSPYLYCHDYIWSYDEE